ncbi:MAG: MBL fold metallo-hydrolase [Candidatus Dadabacteria bacterium]|nr:MBL fold metallo-hydrolase [Candidatus Dadabacteria bacterium]NIQ13350.1 MBL fold metallo-hydrolase [Candidatus Dadabacteria bacterium]
MKITVLGCATSTGVPIVGCKCDVCLSDNPKNKRTRSSVVIHVKHKNILIDTSTDLRKQALKNNISSIDAVLYTHSHADHTHGIDDLRVFNFINKTEITCFANEQTLNNLKKNFGYIFNLVPSTASKPRLNFNVINGKFKYEGIEIVPVDILHSHSTILGYKVGSFAYLTDCSGIPTHSMEELMNLDVLIIDALRYRPHEAHYNVEQAVEIANELNPKMTYLTHMGHELEYEKLNKELPDNIEPAYDGLVIEIKDP